MHNNYEYSYEEKKSWRVDGIEAASKKILEAYYKGIDENSRHTYANYIRKICEKTNKWSFVELDFEDYKKIQNKDCTNSYYNSFFSFLYAFDHLHNENGFEACYWDKKKLRQKYDKRIRNKENPNSTLINKNEIIVTIEEVDKLLNFYDNVSPTDIPNMKLAFCFYALFFLGMPVEKLKTLSSEQIEDRMIDNEYIINEKFFEFLSTMPSEEFTFGQVGKYIEKLCQSVGIKKLMPKSLKLAHDQYTFSCPQCGEPYLSFSDNWQVVNGKIICCDCVELLKEEFVSKKNGNFEHLKVVDIETISKSKREETTVLLSSFDEMKKNVPKPKNYEEINQFLKYIGNLGEKYVLEYEQKRLRDKKSPYWDLVDGSYALDNHNGFDILSYTEKGKKIYIEVKTTTGDVSESFYMSENEFNTAVNIIEKGEIYKLYRVSNILTDTISLEIYDDLNDMLRENVLYRMTIKNKGI